MSPKNRVYLALRKIVSKNMPNRTSKMIVAVSIPSLIVVGSFLVAFFGQSSVSNAASSYQNLVWSDEFNSGSSPDASKWTYDLGGGGWGNGELQTYTSNRTNVRVESGNLIIQADYNQKKKKYTSARVKTLGKFSWQYGRIDVRAQLPTGVGSWPAIWMLPSGAKYGTQYLANGEIDIMEEVGADQNEVSSSAHSLDYNPSLKTTRSRVFMVPTANTEFHVYGLEWNPEYLSYQIDGAEYFRVANDHTGYRSWPYDQPFHLILNLAIGGSWGGYKGVDKSSMPWTYKIDYVRLYK